MRILVMFDLPTGSEKERHSYSTFRKFLISNGYVMEQYSVYSRVTLGRDSLDRHIKRLKANIPVAGSVVALTLTEKQFENRLILLGKTDAHYLANQTSQMTLSF